MCGDCQKHMSYCNCTNGIKAPNGIIKVLDREARILIATGQKCGTGFDHDKLDTLVLASDFEEYFVQYLGRIFRKRDIEPIVYDFVDKNGILEKHFKTRKEIYTEHGGTIKQYDIENLNFEEIYLNDIIDDIKFNFEHYLDSYIKVNNSINIKFNIILEDNLPKKIFTDITRIKQILKRYYYLFLHY